MRNTQFQIDREKYIGNETEGKLMFDGTSASIKIGRSVTSFDLEEFLTFMRTRNYEAKRITSMKKDFSRELRESGLRGWNHNYGMMKLLGMRLQTLGLKSNILDKPSYKWFDNCELNVFLQVRDYCDYREKGWANLHYTPELGPKISEACREIGFRVDWNGNAGRPIVVIIPSEVEKYNEYKKEIGE